MQWFRKEKFQVRGYEVDMHNKAPVQAYCSYMEEAAGLHAADLGLSIERLHAAGITWVLARMQFEVYGVPEAGDEVVVTTWPVGIEKLQFRRDFIITDTTGRELARAVTDWVVVNLESRRVERIPDFISSLHPVKAEHAMEKARINIAAQDGAEELASFRVRKADIDRNRHVNNVRFIDWLLEGMPPEAEGRILGGMQLVFRAEGRYGDTVVAKCSQESASSYQHGLFRATDGQELVRARTFWK